MVERFKLEKFEIGTYSMKWLFGFVFEAVFKLHVNERIFICEPECFDIRGHNPKKDMKRQFFKGKDISLIEATSNNRKVTISFKEGYVYLKEA